MNRHRFAALVLLSALSVWAMPAAQAGEADPPRYDSHVFCRMRASTPEGFSDEAQTKCLAQQNLAYQSIRQEWNELPDEIQVGCDEFTQARDPLDYMALQSCIQTQKRRIPPIAPLDDEP